VDHSHQVIEALGAASNLLGEAESAGRGYMIAGEAFRTEYETAARAVGPALSRVRRLTADNASQQRRVDSLESHARRKLGELAENVRLRDADGIGAVEASLRRQRVNSAMFAFHQQAASVESAERTLLASRASERARQLSHLTGTMLLGALTALLIALFAAHRAILASAARAVAERERDARAEEVALQSGELGAQNEELIAQGEALQVAMELAEGANEAKSVFLAQMSHELRTPLNSVIGFANIVRRNPRGALVDSELNYLDRVVENGRHLLRTINSILDLSKIEANQESVELELVSLPELAREVLASLETQAAAAQITLAVEAPATVTSIVTDRDKLRRVLVNLVANAVKFTKAGSVTIRVETAPRSPVTPIAMEVRDTGIGIAPNRLAAIFEAFEQGDVGVGREYGGTGLGLSISRALCRLLHYELSVSSTLGVGSVFRIALVREGAVPR
jgi:signal transduction histidine kinase